MEATLEKRVGFKMTKLGWIPDDWDIVKFGDLLESKNSLGYGILQPAKNIDGGVHMLRTVDLTDSGIKDINKVIKVSQELSNQYKRTILNGGEVLISVMGTLGRTLVVPNSFKGWNVNRALAVARFKKNVDTTFIVQTLRSPQFERRIIQEALGSAQKRINLNDLKRYPLIYPPLKEQHAISKILSACDDNIADTKQIIKLLKSRKNGLMQQMLTGKKRLNGFDGKWNEAKLGMYFKERKETGFNNLPLLSVGIEGVYPQDQSEKKDTSNSDKSKYKRICYGDIGYNTMRMWQGRSALSKIEGIVSPAYTIVKPNENANPIFFSYLFKLEEMIHKFYRNSQGMVSDTWMCKFKDFSIVKFQAPPTKEEQDAIAEILQSADKEIANYESKLLVLEEQKKGLMQQLLTGQKRVKV